MAQDEGAAGSPDDEPGAAGSEVPDTPEMWGNNGLVGDGRYRLTRRLGRGGMAEVFAAEDVRLGRPVAVKLLRPDLAEDPVSKARFTREAQSVAGLNHHAVVAVYDSGEEQVGGKIMPYIVMELIHGRTIRDLLISAEAPPPEQALIIVSGVLEALAYSHHHGIVHRDIKPANVIITDSGAVKVMDFGIARALHGAAQTMTQTGMVMGTPQYLSPEQALGKTVDTRSDLYAVGCLLYELLTLRPPFVGETPLSVVYQHVQDQARPPSEVSPTAPPELDGLVMRALTKNPDDRFQSAEEMRGMVQYALRMLEEHGGRTGGLWSTGAVSTSGTPPMGTPAATTALHRPGGPMTEPLLLGNAGAGPAAEPPRAGGGGRARMLAVAVLAVLAIAAGVLIAANLGGDGEGGNEPETHQSPTSTETRGGDQTAQSPEETDDGESAETDEEYLPPDSGDEWEEPTDDEDTGSQSPPPDDQPSTPADEPTDTDPPGDDEGADEGTDEGEGGDEEGTSTSSGTDEGTAEGESGGTSSGVGGTSSGVGGNDTTGTSSGAGDAGSGDDAGE
ncbi:protein kinase domain-containing protein [Streptomyces hoynatensis]|uniref:non-specific serine/threonine protein kinase n=1 Tax=Streptomyces hoynatensis TaxID=1141874 RepID=A0A3A9Z4E8_9ACTN|nr:protein kinase [Streptomyces hoynatensis]RKN43135.1 serine/threonine protein kinase [Streptomyces hoynatensis]